MPADRNHRVERRFRTRSAGRRRRGGDRQRTVADLVAERLAESSVEATTGSGASTGRRVRTVADLAAERWPESMASAGAHRLRVRPPVEWGGDPVPALSGSAPVEEISRSPGAVESLGGERRWRAMLRCPAGWSLSALSPWITGPGAATLVFLVVMLVGWIVGGSGATDQPAISTPKPVSPSRHAARAAGVLPHLDAAAAPGVHEGPIDCSRPSRILELAQWKLTLPVGAIGRPTEILDPRLRSYASTYFGVGQACNSVAFRAPVNGVTTVDSQNPRSELREMTGGGAPAAWSSTVGTHTMTVTEAFTRLPEGNPQVVGGQIHDADEDLAVFRLEGTNLYVTNGDDSHYQLVTSNYVLGTPFEAKFVVGGGVIRAYVDGRLVATINKVFSGAYFKAGAYTQANCGDASPCDRDNFGEVLIYALKVTDTAT